MKRKIVVLSIIFVLGFTFLVIGVYMRKQASQAPTVKYLIEVVFDGERLLVPLGSGEQPSVELPPDQIAILFDQENPRLVSSFGGFWIQDDFVYFSTKIVIQNSYATEKTITLHGYLPVDEQSGLLTDAKVIAVDEQGNPLEITIPGNAIIEIEVVFVGNHGNFDMKEDRSLPYLVFTIIE